MKKTLLFCLRSEQERTLERLRELGVVHVKPVRPPAAPALDEARHRLREIRRALEHLPKKAPHSSAKSAIGPEEAVKRIHTVLLKHREVEERLDGLRQLEGELAPFGDFDPQAAALLEAAGVPVRLYYASAKTELKQPAGAVLVRAGESQGNVYFCVVGPHEPCEGWREFPMPEKSLSRIRSEIPELEQRRRAAEKELEQLASGRRAIERLELQAREQVEFLEAREGMGADGDVIYLEGFCPEPAIERLRAAAREHGWGISITDPGPEDDPPTLIETPRWVRPISVVFKFMSLTPGYREFDISTVFLLFFSLFFAMLIGDAAYGLIMLALTFAAGRKFPHAPKPALTLMYILSGCTVVWGVLTGSYFGISLELLPAPLRALTIKWLAGDPEKKNIMALCFFIGALHLSIAFVWNMARVLNSLQALAQLGWLMITWMMYFLARKLILQQPMPGWIVWAGAAGVVLVALFMTPLSKIRQEWYNFMLLPLNVISSFVDVVSYLRLFAVGFAGIAVAQSFNNMASAMFNSVVGGLVGALVLFVGHALNIAMALLGVVVHGVRLNTLEFSGKLGMTWSGVPYAPFAVRSAAGAASESVIDAAEQNIKTEEKKG